jgi:hypothetical protein
MCHYYGQLRSSNARKELLLKRYCPRSDFHLPCTWVEFKKYLDAMPRHSKAVYHILEQWCEGNVMTKTFQVPPIARIVQGHSCHREASMNWNKLGVSLTHLYRHRDRGRNEQVLWWNHNSECPLGFSSSPVTTACTTFCTPPGLNLTCVAPNALSKNRPNCYQGMVTKIHDVIQWYSPRISFQPNVDMFQAQCAW